MADRSDWNPDPLDVLADYHEMAPAQFWATHPNIRAVLAPGSDATDLLHYLGRVVVERRWSRPA